MTISIDGIGKDIDVIFCDVYQSKLVDGGISIANNEIATIFSHLTYEEQRIISNNVIRINYREVFIKQSEVAFVWFHTSDTTLRVKYELATNYVSEVNIIENGGICYTIPDYADVHRWNTVDVVVKSANPLTVDDLRDLDELMFYDLGDLSDIDDKLREYMYCMVYDLLNDPPNDIRLHDVSHIEYDVDQNIRKKDGRWIRLYDSNNRSLELRLGFYSGDLGGHCGLSNIMYDQHLVIDKFSPSFEIRDMGEDVWVRDNGAWGTEESVKFALDVYDKVFWQLKRGFYDNIIFVNIQTSGDVKRVMYYTVEKSICVELNDDLSIDESWNNSDGLSIHLRNNLFFDSWSDVEIEGDGDIQLAFEAFNLMVDRYLYGIKLYCIKKVKFTTDISGNRTCWFHQDRDYCVYVYY